jgi:hypothetical protein
MCTLLKQLLHEQIQACAPCSERERSRQSSVSAPSLKDVMRLGGGREVVRFVAEPQLSATSNYNDSVDTTELGRL